VDLDQPVGVRGGPIERDEREVRALVNFRALVEPLGVLTAGRMELEDLAQDLEVARRRVVEIKPEELSRREETFHRLPAATKLTAASSADDVAARGGLAQRAFHLGLARSELTGGSRRRSRTLSS
jgi:hypothetical protein